MTVAPFGLEMHAGKRISWQGSIRGGFDLRFIGRTLFGRWSAQQSAHRGKAKSLDCRGRFRPSQ